MIGFQQQKAEAATQPKPWTPGLTQRDHATQCAPCVLAVIFLVVF